jgi:hypothetical protein
MSGKSTVTLQWPNDAEFVDYQSDTRYSGPGVYEVPAELERFYRTRGWEDPPEDHDGETEQPSSAINTNQSGPTRDELVGEADGEGDPDADANADAADGESDDGGGSGN